MKKIYLSVLTAMTCCCGYAQTNTFPSTGNVGIGTTSPVGLLHIKALSGTDIVQITKNSASADLDIYSSYNGNDDIQTGSFGYGVRPSNTAWQIWERHTGIDWHNLFTVLPAGNVGIGTSTPTQALTVPITSNANGISLGTYSSLSAGSFAFVGITGADGTFNGGNLTGGDNGSAGMAIVHTTGGLGNSSELAFVTHNNGADSRERVRIDRFGNVGIGVTDTKGYSLAVNGTAIATSMTVKMYASWPDYVFQPAYRLPALSDLKIYISENHHLPEMPSAREVEKDGIDLGEMNKLLTKKVEELTLYLIQQKEEAEKNKGIQQSEIDQLKQQVQLLIKASK